MTAPISRVFLKIRKGEAPHRAMNTPWTNGEGGEICWRLISKTRLDGRLEVIHFIRRRSGVELISAHIVCAVEKFDDLVSRIRQAIEQFAPGLEIELGPVEEFGPEFAAYFIADTEPGGLLPEGARRF